MRKIYPVWDDVRQMTHYFTGTQPIYIITTQCPLKQQDGCWYTPIAPVLRSQHLMRHKALAFMQELERICGPYCQHTHELIEETLETTHPGILERLLNPDHRSPFITIAQDHLRPFTPPAEISPSQQLPTLADWWRS